jgi:transglutaminase-like putative cysteine protease
MDLGTAKTYHLPDWHTLSHPQRLKVIRQIAMMRGRDPRIARLAVSILRKAGTRPRQYERQAAALLKWVQDPKNCYYVNEPGERLQDPIYTIEAKHGDCDDQVLLLCSFFESLGMPWRLCLSGRGPNGEKLRYVEGADVPGGAQWVHIYCMVGTPPFKPTHWYFCECTIEKVPLGWDVLSGDKAYLPEMKKRTGPTRMIGAPRASPGFRPASVPPKRNISPAYAEAYGGGAIRNTSALISAVSGAVGEETGSSSGGVEWQKIGAAVMTGVAVSVFAQLALDWVRGKGVWEGSGSIAQRVEKPSEHIGKSRLIHPSLRD